MRHNHHTVSDEQNVQFRKALDSKLNIIDIDNVKDGLVSKDQEFTCIGCQKRLRPRLGKIRTAHFYHYKNNSCSYETYLHKLGKEIFRREFERRRDCNEPFILRVNGDLVCTRHQDLGKLCLAAGASIKLIDLVEKFPDIKTETRLETFIPDLLIFNDNERVFIEIVVSNPPSLEKLLSGNPIIQINAQQESDFDFLKSGKIDDSVPNVDTHNFNSTEYVDNCEGIRCKVERNILNYIKTINEIKSAFDRAVSNNQEYFFEFEQDFKCTRYIERFDTSCKYSELVRINLIEHYSSCDLTKDDGLPYLILKHKDNPEKDITITAKDNLKKSRNKIKGILILKENLYEIMDLGKGISTQHPAFVLSVDKPIQPKENNCQNRCKNEYQFFLVSKDGGARFKDLPLTDPSLQNDEIYPYKRLYEDDGTIYNMEEHFAKAIEDSFKEGIPIRNCYICRYHALNHIHNSDTSEPIFCKTFRKACVSNTATKCDRYKPDLNSTDQNFMGRY